MRKQDKKVLNHLQLEYLHRKTRKKEIVMYYYCVLKTRVQCVLVLLGIILSSANVAFGFSGGSGYTACKGSMEPKKLDEPAGHGANIRPQTSPPPFELKLDKTGIKAGEEVTMSISRMDDSSPMFQGFLLVVRKGNDIESFGTWKDLGDNSTRIVECYKDPDAKGQGATHTNPLPKSSVKVLWKAPMEAGKYDIFFTVLTNKTTYWNAVQSPKFKSIQVSGSPSPSSFMSIQALVLLTSAVVNSMRCASL